MHPTFLWAAIVGGIIMGGGFILGGFCPGTAFCGVAIGKADALMFVGGLFLACSYLPRATHFGKDLLQSRAHGARNR